MFVAVLLGMAIGVALGALGYRSRLVNAILTPIYDIMQTTPIWSYLVPVLVFFGFGPLAGAARDSGLRDAADGPG